MYQEQPHEESTAQLCAEGATHKQQQHEGLTPKILAALSEIGKVPSAQLEFKTHAIAGIGENSYGLVLQVNLTTSTPTHECRCILKIAPTNSARRSHMRVADYYAREVFMYDVVFRAYRKLAADIQQPLDALDLMPKMLHYCLDERDEFIIFEDLTASNYVVGQRSQLANYDMAAMALRSLGKFHAFSFALQAKETQIYDELIAQLQPDNLFTPDIEPISIEFGKSYIRRARNMIQTELRRPTAVDEHDKPKHIEALDNVERNFKYICLTCVDGRACAPYAVICHGDFWNNNILNKYDNKKELISTKLIDFQMSRYASPVLDLVHYLFSCTTRNLRESHFQHLLHDVYYVALEQQLQLFQLNAFTIYPREVFDKQLRDYGVYGLCMAAFSLPFFVADTTELPDLDKVSEAIKDIGTSNDSTKSQCQVEKSDKDLNESRLKLIEEDFNLLTARTARLFKIRMEDIVTDIVEYGIRTDFNNEAE